MGESTKNVLEVLGNRKMSFNSKKEIRGLADLSVLQVCFQRKEGDSSSLNGRSQS